jgi:hypothetical protein
MTLYQSTASRMPGVPVDESLWARRQAGYVIKLCQQPSGVLK